MDEAESNPADNDVDVEEEEVEPEDGKIITK